MEEERTRLQKIVLLALAVMAVVFGILMAVSKLHPGVLLDGALLRPTETADGVTYTGKLHGEQVSISVGTESDTVTVITCETESGGSDVYRMEYPLDPIPVQDQLGREQIVDGIRITKNGDDSLQAAMTGRSLPTKRPGMMPTASGTATRISPPLPEGMDWAVRWN